MSYEKLGLSYENFNLYTKSNKFIMKSTYVRPPLIFFPFQYIFYFRFICYCIFLNVSIFSKNLKISTRIIFFHSMMMINVNLLFFVVDDDFVIFCFCFFCFLIIIIIIFIYLRRNDNIIYK